MRNQLKPSVMLFGWLFFISVLMSAGCTDANWVREEYKESIDKRISDTTPGYSLSVSFLPQNYFGYKKTSYKGPYKIKVFCEGESGKFTDLMISSITSKLLSSGTTLEHVATPVELPFKVLSGGASASFFVSDKVIAPDIQENEAVEVTVEYVLVNRKTGQQSKAKAIMLFSPKVTKGITTIPWFTT